MSKQQSNGTLGEQLAELWFRQHGWVMFRTQPPTKVVYVKGKPTVINCDNGGIADYTGYVVHTRWTNIVAPYYIAVEVKEAHGKSMPASRLNRKQRDWMTALPEGCAYVAVVWVDGNPWCEVFPFVARGPYRQGGGWK